MADNTKYWQRHGHVQPQVEYSESHRPHIELTVAPWLPLDDFDTANPSRGTGNVAIYDKEWEEYLVVAAGRPVAISRDGYLVPAGLFRRWKAAGANDIVLRYKQLDEDQVVQSLKSKATVDSTDVTANTSTGWKKSDMETALRARGLLGATEGLENFISAPIGYASYPYYQAASKTGNPENPSTYRKHNFAVQKRVAIGCDYVLQLPWVPAKKATINLNTGSFGTVTQINATSLVYYFQIDDAKYLPLAPDNGQTTKWAFGNDTNSYFVNAKSSIAECKAVGDYFVDVDLGRIYFYHGTQNDAAAAALKVEESGGQPIVNMTFYHYSGIPAGQTVYAAAIADQDITSKYACVVGPIQMGDYLVPTAKSNWARADKAQHSFATGVAMVNNLDNDVRGKDASTTFGNSYADTEINDAFKIVNTNTTALNTNMTNLTTALSDLMLNAQEQSMILGQVLSFEKFPNSGLQRVRTAGQFLPDSMIQDRMPGMATGGLPDKLTYTGGADTLVRVNIINK